MSRKPVSNKKKTVSVNLSEGTIFILNRLADDFGVSRSMIVRDFIEDDIKKLQKRFKKIKQPTTYRKVRDKLDVK